MTLLVFQRVLQGIGVVFAMSLAVFLGVFAIGDPLSLLVNPTLNQAEIAVVAERLGLDMPLWRQYLHFLANLMRGDLGNSFVSNTPAIGLILERMPATLELAVTAVLVGLVVGIPLGLWAGYRPEHWTSKTIMTGSILGFSLPTFWVGLMLIMIFAIELGWLDSGGRGETRDWLGMKLSVFTLDGWSHLLLPAANLALFKISLVIRLTRAGVREALAQDYVRFARAKGLTMRRILVVHVLPNILIPVVTVTGMELSSTIAYAVVTETIFSWPGMGKLVIDSIFALDRPVIVAYLMIMACLFVAINLLVDLGYLVLDPRLRHRRAA
ncbi:MAG: ABC transporter permease [Telmatospirillum sp.]|nr:ABC transporter permease [Telmatospirillum sp.]